MAFKLLPRGSHYIQMIGEGLELMYIVVSRFVSTLVFRNGSCECAEIGTLVTPGGSMGPNFYLQKISHVKVFRYISLGLQAI